MLRNSKFIKYLIIGFAFLSAMFSYYIWQIAKTPNFETKEKKEFVLYIHENSNFEAVWDTLSANKVIRDELSFKFLAKILKYKDHVKPGRYVLTAEMGNYEAIQKLKLGEQDPVKLTFNNVRLKKDLIKKIGHKFEFDSTEFAILLDSEAIAKKYGFTKETIMCMFLPNTYKVMWNTKPEKLFERMKQEYDIFWTEERRKKAAAIGLDPIKAQIMASIVEGETKKIDEKPRVAGVYMNRYNKGMLLQADPTVVFAAQDFSIRRVSLELTHLDSPYNTYKYVGLPPGPINLPDLTSIEAVLDYEKHNYLFFCAKEDFSGYHNFAATYSEHMNNAKTYQAALNSRKIMK
ncbi:MAG: endolytic transglycosylase MltG [Pseudarcicella sp.]|nr:endolytic transglycosylase MltG [Pseudarcicella sp.]MBP6410474.1 endolytic transglycosylase MltG [Pseudarcicella sp.]